jgi:hypothetical protein
MMGSMGKAFSGLPRREGEPDVVGAFDRLAKLTDIDSGGGRHLAVLEAVPDPALVADRAAVGEERPAAGDVMS